MAHNHFGPKDVTKVQIYAVADEIEEFTQFFKHLGMTQREAGSRLFAWFNRQSPLIRQQILQPMPEEVAPDIAKIILERMAEQDRMRQSQADQTTAERPALPTHLTAHGPSEPAS
jgi:hypothetical protein